MKMKSAKKLTMTTVIAACFLLMSFTQAYAYRGEKKMEALRQYWFEELTKDLGLSETQKQDLEKQRSEFAAKRKDIVEKLEAKTAKLKDELEKADINKAAVDRLIEEIKDLSGQQLHSRVDSVIATKKILTPEQFKKLQEKAQKKRLQFRERRGRFFNR